MLIAYGLLIAAVGMDLKSMRINNRLILVSLGIALVRRFICEGILGVFTGIFLICVPVILLYLLFLAGALGAGDIKLFSVVGGFVSLKELLWCIVFAFIFAAAFSLMKMLFFGTLFSSMKNVGKYISKLGSGIKEPYVPQSMSLGRIHFSIAILLGLFATNIFIS